jgi:hypothetical protein
MLPVQTLQVGTDQTLDPTVEQWLGSDYIEDLVGVVKGRIDAFYGKVAESLAKPSIKYFAEKCGPGATVQPLFWEIYPNAREIFLVRDFRDMAASMLAYGKKRGYQFFGRDKYSSDEDYLRGLRSDAQVLLDQWNERPSSACLLKYEDLIRTPVEALTSVLSYIGVQSDRGVVKKMIQDASQVRVPKQDVHRTSPGGEESIGRWQSLEEPLRKASDEAFGDILDAFGY